MPSIVAGISTLLASCANHVYVFTKGRKISALTTGSTSSGANALYATWRSNHAPSRIATPGKAGTTVHLSDSAAEDKDLYYSIAAFTTRQLANRQEERVGIYKIISGTDRWGYPRAYALKEGDKQRGRADTLLLLTQMRGATLCLDENTLVNHPDLPLDEVFAAIATMRYRRMDYQRAEEAFVSRRVKLNDVKGKPTYKDTCVVLHGWYYSRRGRDCDNICEFHFMDTLLSVPDAAQKWYEAQCNDKTAINIEGQDSVWTMHRRWSSVKRSDGSIPDYIHSTDGFIVNGAGKIGSDDVAPDDEAPSGAMTTSATAAAKAAAGTDTISFFSRACSADWSYAIRILRIAGGKYDVLLFADTSGTQKSIDSALAKMSSAIANLSLVKSRFTDSVNMLADTVLNAPGKAKLISAFEKQSDKTSDSLKVVTAALKQKTLTYHIDGTPDGSNIATWIAKKTGDAACSEIMALQVTQKIAADVAAAADARRQALVDSLALRMESIADSLHEYFDGDAGQFVLNKQRIQVYDRNGSPIRNEYFDPVSVAIRTDYNRIHTLAITGNLHLPGGSVEKMVVGNRDASLTMFRLNTGFLKADNYEFDKHSYQGYSLKMMNREDEFIAANDAVLYIPKKERIHYMVKNQDLYMDASRGWKVDVAKRSLNDYLSLRIFLDPFGFLSNVPNGLLQAEGHATIPMNIRRPASLSGIGRKLTFFPESESTFSTVYAATSNNANRLITPDSSRAFLPPDSPHVFRNYINNFDFFRKYNVQFNFRQSIIAVESKTFNCWMHFRIGFDVFGANGQLRQDTTGGSAPQSAYLSMFYPTVGFKFEFRPDANYGFYTTIDYLLLGGSYFLGNNLYNSRANSEFTYRANVMLRNELTYYARVGNYSSGGLFFKMTNYIAKYYSQDNVYYGRPALEEKKTWAFFPQILIGYSTNISAFIKQVNTHP